MQHRPRMRIEGDDGAHVQTRARSTTRRHYHLMGPMKAIEHTEGQYGSESDTAVLNVAENLHRVRSPIGT